MISRVCLGLILVSSTHGYARLSPSLGGASAVVRRLPVDPSVPVFVAVHPRIATTVSFPRPIGAPMGTGFVEAEAYERALAEGRPVTSRGEYAISFVEGESFFTVQPLAPADLLNLNVPFEGRTLVLYFYPVELPLEAVASLVFSETPAARLESPRETPVPELEVNAPPGTGTQPSPSLAPAVEPETAPAITRRTTPPEPAYRRASPARLDGFLRKLRAIHAARRGSELDAVADAMGVQVAVTQAEDPGSTLRAVRDAGAFQLILLRIVREPRLDAVGFVVLLRNPGEHPVRFDLRSFSARCGAALYQAQVVDAPEQLDPGDLRAGYFVIVGAGDGRPAHLSAHNDWRLSLGTLESPEPSAPPRTSPAEPQAPEPDAAPTPAEAAGATAPEA